MTEHFHEQPDGRMVAGPQPPSRDVKRRLDYRLPALAVMFVLVLGGFFLGRGLGGEETSRPPWQQGLVHYGMERFGGTGCRGISVVISPLNRPLTGSDATQIEQSLLAGGYLKPDVIAVSYRGNDFAIMSAGFNCPLAPPGA